MSTAEIVERIKKETGASDEQILEAAMRLKEMCGDTRRKPSKPREKGGLS